MKLLPGRRVLPGAIAIVPLLLSLMAVQPALAAGATADVSITLVANHTNVKVGQEVVYLATVTNHGPADAAFVDAVFSWPAQLQPVSMTCDKGISADGPDCEYSTLKAGETVVSTFVAMPQASAQRSARKFTVSARINFEIDCSFDPSCTADPTTADNSAWVMTRLIGAVKPAAGLIMPLLAAGRI